MPKLNHFDLGIYDVYFYIAQEGIFFVCKKGKILDDQIQYLNCNYKVDLESPEDYILIWID